MLRFPGFMIEEYKFGYIIIDERTHDQDVEVRWTDDVLAWRRKDSHIIDVEDIRRAAEQNPDTIVIGTGESGIAMITDEAQDFIRARGIELVIDRTEEAAKTFNVINDESFEEDGKQNKVIGLFHLTC
ncbi:MAG: MTH938/NDUFAF3 family protein [bacterium]|nr:MTH938/NDUFAF3 family protein [bacterium]